MTNSKNDGADRNEPRDVGYGKPPKDKQFQKGRSGYPSGRPKQHKKFKSVSRVLRETLLVEVEGLVNGKRSKMLRLEAIIARQVASALQGNVQSAKFLLALADKHIPNNLSLEELMEGRSVFEFTPEDADRFSKARLMEGMEDLMGSDGQPVL